MSKKRFLLLVSVISLVPVFCISCSKDHGIRTSFSKGILSARNDSLEISLNISTGEIEFKDKEGRPVLRGTSDYSITNGKVIEGTYNYDLETIENVSPADYKKHKWTKHKIFTDKGEGREFVITHSGYAGYPDLIQRMNIDEVSTAIFLIMSLSDVGESVKAPLLISELRVLGFKMTEKESHWFTPIKKNVLMERQGTRRPSDRRVIVTLDNEKFPKDYDHGVYNKWMRRETDTELKYISESLTSLIHSENQKTLFMGFVTQHDQATQIIARRIKNDPEYLEVSCRCDIEGTPFSGRHILNSEVLMVDFISAPKTAKEAYIEEIRERHGQPEKKELGAVWETWTYYRKYMTEDEIIKNMDAIKEIGIPIEYIHLDDGYQNVEEEWLGGNFRFPHGMKWMADEIYKRGFKPRIWLNPFITLTESNLSKQHPEYMVKDRNGKLMEAHSHNMGIYEASGQPTPPVHIIDYTVPGAREYLRNLINTLVHEWGWKYLKIDGPWRINYYEQGPRGPLSDPTVTTIGNFTIAYKIIREVMGEGDDIYLHGCGGYFGPSYGNANSHTVSQDWTPDWATQISHMLSSNLSIYPWPCPGTGSNTSGYRINYKPSPLYEKWILQQEISDGVTRINYTNSAISQKKLMSLSGKVHSLSADDKKRLHQYLPAYESEVKRIEGLPESLPSLSREGTREKKITCSWGEWSLLGLLNHSPEKEAEISLPISSLSVPQNSKYYHAFDFWREKYYGKFVGEISVKVPPADALMLTIRPLSGHPEILSTNMHYTQGAVDMKDVNWDDRDMKLHFSSDFDYQVDVKIFIYVPENYSIKSVQSSGVNELRNKLEGEILTLSYKKGEAKTDFTITFKKL